MLWTVAVILAHTLAHLGRKPLTAPRQLTIGGHAGDGSSPPDRVRSPSSAIVLNKMPIGPAACIRDGAAQSPVGLTATQEVKQCE
jgi:hypothetical protein